jgi:hypothetical protein
VPDIWALMRAIRGSSLSAPEKHVLLTLTSLIDPGTGLIPERFQPSLTDLTRYTGLGRSTIARSLNSTEESGWVKRTVPTKYASQKNKEKTSYLLVIPADEPTEEPAQASPTVGLVPERDQPESWSQSGTSATAGLGLVPQRDQVSPTVGLKELNLCTSMNQPPPTEGASTQLAIAVIEGEVATAADTIKAKPKAKKRKRLSRIITTKAEPLPDDWFVSEEMIEWARQETPNVGRFATDKFLDHFGSEKTGKKLKKDWDATWRNWMRSDQERFEERTGYRGDPPNVNTGTAMSRLDNNGRRAGDLIRSPADQRVADGQVLYEKYKREQENARG